MTEVTPFAPPQSYYVHNVDEWFEVVNYTKSYNESVTHVYIMNDIDFSEYVDELGYPKQYPVKPMESFYQDLAICIHGNGHTISNVYFNRPDTGFAFIIFGSGNYNNSGFAVENLFFKDFYIVCNTFRAFNIPINKHGSFQDSHRIYNVKFCGVIQILSASHFYLFDGVHSSSQFYYNCLFDLRLFLSPYNSLVYIINTEFAIIQNCLFNLRIFGSGHVRLGHENRGGDYQYTSNCVVRLFLEGFKSGWFALATNSYYSGRPPMSLLVLIEEPPRNLSSVQIYLIGLENEGRLVFYDKTKCDEMGVTILSPLSVNPAIGETTEHLKDGAYMYETYGLISD